MGRFAQIAGVAATSAALLSTAACTRLELQDAEEIGPEALRLSSEDSVVLCPLSVAAEASGSVSIVWAGYPPADDRLQLMHARVSAEGSLMQAPQSIALLGDELAALQIEERGGGLQIQLLEHEASEALALQMDHTGAVLSEELVAPTSGWVGESCESAVYTGDAWLLVSRAQVDGVLSLFVEATSL